MLVVVLLGVVVSRDPVRLVVTRHSELRELALDHIEVAILPPGEFVAEAQPVVEETEADSDRIAIGLLLEFYEEFIIVVADLLHFAPYGCPRLIEGRLPRRRDLQILIEGLLPISHL